MILALVLAAALQNPSSQGPFLSPTFGDHMVLQRNKPNAFWGWTTPHTAVSVTIGRSKARGESDDSGKWVVMLRPPGGPGPYEVDIDGPQHVALQDVLVGDVWLCGGQSNMEFGVGNLADPATVEQGADNPNIRLYMVPHNIQFEPATVNPAVWKVCTPTSIAEAGWNGFSAVGYFFGRKLQHDLNVPIGLVEDCWGGTIAEAWTSENTVRDLGGFTRAFAAKDRAKALGDHSNPNLPTVLYDGMICPVAPLAIRGAIWYQGESNADRAYQYRDLLPAMIGDWRSTFAEGDFPFYIVSLASFMKRKAEPGDDAWAELREAQAMTAARVRHSGLALAIDVGNADDIHPKDKKTVGDRLAIIALAREYGKNIPYSGPVYKRMHIEGSTIRIDFDHADAGLAVHGDKLDSFAIAGADHKWYWADAHVDGNSVVLSSPSVPNPIAARYAWQANPPAPLYNGEGLPAVPFRTDDWHGVTYGKT